MPAHVRSGDTVIVTAGSDRGRTGTVLKIIPKRSQVVVQGINTRTKHLKATQANPQGGVITKEMPIHLSNVSPVVDGRATRVRFVTRADGSKVRVAARGGQELSTLHGPRVAGSGGGVKTGTRKASAKKSGGKKKGGGGKARGGKSTAKASGSAASSIKRTGTGRKV